MILGQNVNSSSRSASTGAVFGAGVSSRCKKLGGVHSRRGGVALV